MIYEPREDSYLLLEQIKKYSKGKVLDIGTGSGIQALEAAKNADFVLATDINEEAIDYCERDIKNKKIKFIQSDLFKSINEKFDLIIFNPPYLPYDETEDEESSLITTGGVRGYEILDKFFSEVKGYLSEEGKILIVVSSLTNFDEIIKKYEFKFKILSEKKLFFEKIFVYLIENFKNLAKT